ncbi:MAG TPA: SiaB family protein kinase [Ohtaekwangia sp.]|uniref:SiaB family protein kinase n=1 Tax=Ohtaekwangia sp. TaxID=2066019 RepID=UPI002F952D68
MEDKKNARLMDLYSTMNEQDIIIYYKGPFDDVILAEIGNKIRKKVFESPKVGKRLFAVFMELAQNVSLYSSEKNLMEQEVKWGVGTLVVYENPETYMLVSGNMVRNEVLEQIIQKCTEINQLDRENLRALKRKYRSAEIAPDHKGGNIGLIQVALKSDFPLQIDARRIDDKHSFFTISVQIYRHEDATSDGEGEQ